MNTPIAVEKDPNGQKPIPSAWRETISTIVESIRDGDYRLSSSIPGVIKFSDRIAKAIQENIEGYGAHLVGLPEDAWHTSTCQWMGSYCDVLVDLSPLRKELATWLFCFESQK